MKIRKFRITNYAMTNEGYNMHIIPVTVGAKLLTVQREPGEYPYLWVLENENENRFENRIIYVLFDECVVDLILGKYLGTYQLNESQQSAHCFAASRSAGE